jgi:putative transposase
VREYRKGSHSVYDINYHFVWITKYRYPVLRGDLATRARDIVREVCMACDAKILKGVVSKDHIHLLVSCPPTLAPSRLVQLMKGKSSFRLAGGFPVDPSWGLILTPLRSEATTGCRGRNWFCVG